MKRISAKSWLASISLLALCCAAAGATLTKDDVIRMARSGESDRAILDAIRDSHAAFELTADDIADLRNAGVSDAVIDTMTETGDQAYREQGTSDESHSEYPPPPVYEPGYPFYPLYYPDYYPVFDPFFPFYGGFLFSFQFVHVSGLFTVFPCDRSVLVVRSPVVARGASVVTARPGVFSTPRTLPRGSAAIARTSLAPRPSRMRGALGPASAPMGGMRTFGAPRGMGGGGHAHGGHH